MSLRWEDCWEYCECGCHGHELKIAGLRFWCFQSIIEKSGKMYIAAVSVHKGHGFSGDQLFYKTYSRTDDPRSLQVASEAVRPLLIARLHELYEQVADLESYLSPLEVLAATQREKT